jgi:hypothetical protein
LVYLPYSDAEEEATSLLSLWAGHLTGQKRHWKTFGKILEWMWNDIKECWNDVGKTLEKRWKNVGKTLE